MRYRYWITVVAGILLGLILVTAGVGKLLGQSAFVLSVQFLPNVNPGFVSFVAHYLPWAEIVVGVCLIIGIATRLVAILSTMLIAVFIFYNSWMISHGQGFKPCSCLGAFEKLFQGELSSTTALYVDVGLLALAVLIFFSSTGKFFNLRPWFLRRAKTGGSLAGSQGGEGQ
jgi:uncharacterized membrane protein YphA (DoxX/SURF4 family)